MPKDYFDERMAEGYDSSSEETFEPAFVDSVVSFLADLAGDGGALEFGLGTGRIALPLSQRGVRVHGIVARLHPRRGAGTELVAVAVREAKAAGCASLHVDFEDHLRRFYFDRCGIKPTNAGLVRLKDE